MPTYDEIIRSLKQRKPQRVYLLAGDEPLFIDQIASFATKELIPAEEQDFNQSILYGAEVNARTILLEALRFPMMGSQVLVLVREAQQVRDLDTLAAHLDELPESTCLILCYKKKADKRKALYKAISERGGVFESTKMYDSKIPDFIIKSFAARQLDIDPRTAHLMADSTGNDLEKILNEVEKIALALSEKGTRTVTPEVIEYYIGVSKEYNNFELLTALIRRDAVRAYRIALYFASDERNHPIQMTLSTLFGFFSNLMAVYYIAQPNERSIASLLGVQPFVARDYDLARRGYSAAQTFAIIHQIRLIDAYSKGVDANIPTSQFYSELVSRILAA
ncbi:DNA polymerase III subunit delta [uncultured Porphyromonas sp.]|uniref:DNA polymerase III subunit delta n=1 Tax=uncultured Porphyromonas sp. TaxID=159274 RepID=UPI0025919EB6|nr:DNA polymerase III subunit delta [uncultured Porphyromonas sp.]